MVKFKFNYSQVEKLQKKQRQALRKGAEAVLGRLRYERFIPHETGRLEASTRVDASNIEKNRVKVVSDVPYAVFVYHRPNVVFTRTVNWNARAFWFEPFITGRFRGLVLERFVEELRDGN